MKKLLIIASALMLIIAFVACDRNSTVSPTENMNSWFKWNLQGSYHEAVSVTDPLDIPVLQEVDVMIVGSSIDGCFLARKLSDEGKSVVLTSSGTSLPRQTTMALRPWISMEALEEMNDFQQEFFNSCAKDSLDGALILDIIKISEGFENILYEAGCQLYYDMHPCGVEKDKKRVSSVIFGSKGGLVAIKAKEVIDCTPDALVASLAGSTFKKRQYNNDLSKVRYSMYTSGWEKSEIFKLDSILNNDQMSLQVHGDFFEFNLMMKLSDHPFAEAQVGLEARRRSSWITTSLKQHGYLEGIQFIRGGDKTLTDPILRLKSRSKGSDDLVGMMRPKTVNNLMVYGPCMDIDNEKTDAVLENSAGAAFASSLASHLLQNDKKIDLIAKQNVIFNTQHVKRKNASSEIASFRAIGPIYSTGSYVKVNKQSLPVIGKCEVLVIGAGTSGYPAALMAAKNGAKTVVIEKYGDVGGTHTIGGVSKYWYGRKTSFLKSLNEEAFEMMDASGMPKATGMLHALMRSGAHLITHCISLGTITEDATVKGVVVNTANGLGVIKASTVIDATGDADIAARAGSNTNFGTRRDNLTMYFSFARFRGTNPEAARHFDCIVDQRDPADLTRAIVSSRRRGPGRGPDDFPQYYLTPRESRHINATDTITVADILSGRKYGDMIVIGRSNFDIKGIADSDLFTAGFIEDAYEKNYSVQLPYRVFFPADLKNLMVIGKAYSITHDALALARMQRDLVAVGGTAGIAASMAIESSVIINDVNISDLQSRLVEVGILTQKELNSVSGVEDNLITELSDEVYLEMIDQQAEGSLSVDGQVALLSRPAKSAPLMIQTLEKPGMQDNLHLGRALCYLGEKLGCDIVFEELTRQVQVDELPLIFERYPRQNPSPDHAYAPPISFMMNMLGQQGDDRIIPLMSKLAQKIKMNPEKSDMMYHYVLSICYAADRLASPDCLEALEIIADNLEIKDRLMPLGTDIRISSDRKAERYAYLELSAARAMARCGSKEGYSILIEYLKDVRGVLARSAYDELKTLSKKDFSYDQEEWQDWLLDASIQPKPYTEKHH
jgi:ribulose 1,5-bisphosphate synthetase/thiazole synthase